MILYTPLSEHDIFPPDEEEYNQYKWVTVENRVMKVQDLKDGTYEILQTLSTDPNDYLNNQFTPGTRIRL
ncbi:YlzJ-like protein [Salinibacillus kushneri]|uniref:YlzJ-like protein n=1 Tax=Salinibacillus kushneri TaxID=237682 RepID=A0A1I0E517_9BACI|nr:YlzJ-like family protein [Salinibacillus kushneri]SET39864.1 YlzJ-like protein [Salinibacillus kushneri]